MLKPRTQPVDTDTIAAMERVRDAARKGAGDGLDSVIATELANRPRSVELANVASAAYAEVGDSEASNMMIAFSLATSGPTPVMLAKVAERLRQRGLAKLSGLVSL